MDKVRVAIVGTGGMGSHHARYLVKGAVPEVELVAVCDINPERLRWAKENLGEGIRAFENAEALLDANVKRLDELQYLLYAENRRAVLIVLQAMDAGGKDGTIRHVMGALNPQGVTVTSFKAPSAMPT